MLVKVFPRQVANDRERSRSSFTFTFTVTLLGYYSIHIKHLTFPKRDSRITPCLNHHHQRIGGSSQPSSLQWIKNINNNFRMPSYVPPLLSTAGISISGYLWKSCIRRVKLYVLQHIHVGKGEKFLSFLRTWIRRVQCVLLIYLYLNSQMCTSHILGLGEFNVYFWYTCIWTVKWVFLTY